LSATNDGINNHRKSSTDAAAAAAAADAEMTTTMPMQQIARGAHQNECRTFASSEN